MIYYPNKVPMTDRLRELVSGSEPDFPYAAMEADLDLYPDRCTPWHWHDYFEFALVARGELMMYTQKGGVRLKKGDGYFINGNVLHRSEAASKEGSVIHAQLFSRELLVGAGLIGRKYVSPVENCVEMEFLALKRENAVHREMMDVLAAAFSAAEKECAGYEMEISFQMMRLWRMLYHLAEPKLKAENPPAREDSVRTKQMLKFIHEHYGEGIAVKHIAAAAGICERECYRCFEKVLDSTPQGYLTRHRIHAAARMLAETDKPVGQIALECGFSGAGYFGKVFRSVMGCSPRDFRKDI